MRSKWKKALIVTGSSLLVVAGTTVTIIWTQFTEMERQFLFSGDPQRVIVDQLIQEAMNDRDLQLAPELKERLAQGQTEGGRGSALPKLTEPLPRRTVTGMVGTINNTGGSLTTYLGSDDRSSQSQGGNSAADGAIVQDPQEQIRQKYNAQLLSLQQEGEQNIDQMLGNAKSEYVAARSRGSKIEALQIVRRTYQDAKQMQSSYQQRFEGIITNLEKELQAQGLSTEMVQDARIYYQQRVQEQQVAVYNKYIKKR
ncbi:hypothetical protein [Heliophilum fasciatum]|uniref:Uncharacterized protein n=1 Tax=Heliophilum fasciatum TaxID=35700 RepID=A0A4R2RLN6_9FIRM|nr:hypothetical protein [Heliophilum fasciatum]MCW2279006.1 hypothetical protein [Heliophilum fasciatum]TCP64043.1 hypothetical protein EDD73_1124 [Heliophilum fasciatum]